MYSTGLWFSILQSCAQTLYHTWKKSLVKCMFNYGFVQQALGTTNQIAERSLRHQLVQKTIAVLHCALYTLRDVLLEMASHWMRSVHVVQQANIKNMGYLVYNVQCQAIIDNSQK